MAIQVIVIGAGVAGLCAAVALRRAGHNVKVFEKSQFSTEVGAALASAPNGTSVLQKLGFDFVKAKCVPFKTWEIVNAQSLERIQIQDISKAGSWFGSSYQAIHRVDLQQGLLDLAAEHCKNDQTAGSHPPAIELRLATKVLRVNADKGEVYLEDGTCETADLVVGADGLHSVVRSIMDEQLAQDTGMSAFRFLVPTEKIRKSLPQLLESKTLGATIVVDMETSQNRNIVWYACRGGELYNFVGIHPTRLDMEKTDALHELLDEFKNFHPGIVKLLSLGEHVSKWCLFDHKPISTWAKGNTVLIGDAAHPMLPYGGQAGNQAIEDGGALEVFFRNVQDVDQVPHRLQWFTQFRQRRASRVQILSSARSGNEHLVAEQLKPYLEPGVDLPDTLSKRIAHDADYDVIEEAEKYLQAVLTEQHTER